MSDVIHQAGRQLQITTPLGPDALILTSFAGGGSLSGLFSYDVDMFSQTELEISAAKIVGKKVDVSIASVAGDEPVVFNAHVRRFGGGGLDARGARVYNATLVPWLWFLTCRSNCRIFQEMSIRDIVEKVLSEHSSDFELSLKATYPKREYCVQYNETDFAFVSRLLEEVGITYYFEHERGRHQMVLTDDPKAFQRCRTGSVEYRPDMQKSDAISSWAHQYEYRPGRVTHRDFHFVSPAEPHEASEPTLLTKISDAGKHELYEYPGGFTWTSKASGDPLDPDPKLTQVRMLGEESAHEVVQGTGMCLAFAAGLKFTLDRHDVGAEEKKEYLLTHVEHVARDGAYFTGSGGEFHYSNRFRCVPADVRFVPDRTTPRPRIDGVQTATVTGPDGEDIYVDEYGRVKVLFHWDREGKRDEKSSCWIRVAQSSAGKQWGSVYHPRIGQEVVVHFLEGDPDKPLVTGVVYNADLMPPYELPGKKNVSGYKSHSTLKGTPDHFNALTFDDTKDKELVYFHAQHDFERVVENDDRLKVGFDKAAPGSQTIEVFNNQDVKIGCDKADDGSQTIEIYKDRTVTLKTGNDTLTVDEGDRKITITKGARTTTIEKDDTLTVKTGSRVATINKDDKITVKTGNRAVKVSAGKNTVEAMQHIQLKVAASTVDLKPAFIEIKCGPSKIKIDPSGVSIEGVMVKIKGAAMLDLKSPMTMLKGDGMVMIKGGIVMIN